MKLSLEWLGDWVDIPIPPEELAERLTMVGLAVDAVIEADEGLAGIITARVESVSKHPNAERLSLCRVFDGTDTVDVVCGAPNVQSGGIYPFAPVGVTLSNGMEISVAKLRGEKSYGMLCSEAELGLSDAAAGLMELPADVSPGTPIAKHLGTGGTVLELDVAYNRPDWLSVRGVAREIAAMLSIPLKEVESAPKEGGGKAADGIAIEIENLDDCRLYGGRIVRNVKIGPSPDWLRRRLESIGQRAINNVVDVTNYILHTYGQPIHAFDLAKLRGGVIRVRRATTGERLETLDGTLKNLDPDMLVIADGEGPVAIAGVMGGAHSEVTDPTTELLLESAHFTAPVVRDGAAKLGMDTEASMRFGRGVDLAAVLTALDHTARLIAEVAGGEVLTGQVSAGSDVEERPPVTIRSLRVEQLLGDVADPQELAPVLDRLGFKPVSADGEGGASFACRVPSWRHDVEHEIDLIEEIARFRGYDRYEDRHLNLSGVRADRNPIDARIGRSSSLLAALGLQEILTSSFVSDNVAETTQRWGWAEGDPVKLINARSQDSAVLRGSLWPLHLRVARHNINRGQEGFRLFEHGKIFAGTRAELPVERWELAGIVCGPLLEPGWAGKSVAFELFELKGMLTSYLRGMGRGDAAFASYAGDVLLPDEAFTFEDRQSIRGRAGRIAPRVARAWDIPDTLWLFSIDFQAFLELDDVTPCYRESSRFPGVKRDLAFVVPSHVTHGELEEAMTGSGRGLVRSIRLFDLYQGPPIPAGHKSLAYSLVFQSSERSLLNEEVDDMVTDITSKLAKAYGAVLRDS